MSRKACIGLMLLIGEGLLLTGMYLLGGVPAVMVALGLLLFSLGMSGVIFDVLSDRQN